MNSDERQLLDEITDFYVSSHDFNGMPLVENESVRKALVSLTTNDLVSVNFGDRHPNPHILAFEPESIEERLQKLETLSITGSCAYPRPSHLEGFVDRESYDGQPFSLELSLGYPQLSYHFFELDVLERYRNDPRYYYRFDISGSISVHDEYYQQPAMAERHQVLMQSFGLALARTDWWAIVAFRRYLHQLSSEHQQIWKAHQLYDRENYSPHPGYWRTSMGDWDVKISLFHAITQEMYYINSMCDSIGWPHLFRNTYEIETPNDFGYLIRPTASEFSNFAAVLDRMLSDNLNRQFFAGTISLEEETTGKDGRVRVSQKGTIRLLQEWIAARFKTSSTDLVDHAIETFKQVRKLRNPGAHAIRADVYDLDFFEKQVDLVRNVYRALLSLRQMLQFHPRAATVDVPNDLEDMNVWEM